MAIEPGRDQAVIRGVNNIKSAVIHIKKVLEDIVRGTFVGYIHQNIPGAFRNPRLAQHYDRYSRLYNIVFEMSSRFYA